MKVLLAHGGGQDADAWLGELRAALPDVTFDVWHPGLPPDYDVALVWNPSQRLFDEQPRLQAAFNLGAGVDALLALRLPPALRILRLEDAGMAVQMAEYACHALIDFFREFDTYREQQRQGVWHPRAARRRADFAVGVMGLGAIGARVAQAVRAFDFPVLGWSRTRRALDGVRCFAGTGELDDFLAITRVLVCLLPLTADTRGILDARHLGLLQAGSCLINLARGALLVEGDLRTLLDSGHLARAVLDVTAEEPLPAGHWLWSHPRVTLTPHISGITLRPEAIAQAIRAIRVLQHGGEPPGRVDRSRGY